MFTNRSLLFSASAGSVLCLAACSGEQERKATSAVNSPAAASAAASSPAMSLPAGLTPLAAAQLDSGNVAFRLKQYSQALLYYEHASVSVPDHPAPWYGVYMVASAQGNRTLADSALKMVGDRSGGGELLQQGVSAQHGQATATTASETRAAAPAVSGGTSMVSRHPVLGTRP